MATREKIWEGIVSLIEENTTFTKGKYSPLAGPLTSDVRKMDCKPSELASELLAYLHSQGGMLKVKCPDCEWSQFQDGEAVGMTPCLSCNSTGYIYKPLIEKQEGIANE